MFFFLIPNSRDSINPDTWVDLYADILYRFAIFRLNDKNLAEDLVQETFLSALKNLHNFKKSSSIQTWLISILKNKIIDQYRKSYKEDDYNTISDYEKPSYTENGMWKQELAPQDWQKSGDQVFEEEEFMDILQQCLTLLSGQCRNVFTLREVDGLQSKEICKKLGISSSNLWVLLHRARNGLRKCIEKRWLDQ